MPELIASITSAISIAKKIMEVSEKTRDANFKMLVADLNIKLAEAKMQLADVLTENLELKSKIRGLESIEGDPCPKCKKRTWQLESSVPDPIMGEMGIKKRTYKCSACGFTEFKVTK